MLTRATVTAAAAALLVTGAGVGAAQAHTASEAIQAGCGSGYSVVRDGTRNLVTTRGEIWGQVYLTYNSSTGYSCVVTRKTAFHGTSTKTLARLSVQGSTVREDWAYYSHWAAVKSYARGRCVAYWGDVRNPTGTDNAGGGRWTWGNCG
ncbi:putative membrane protein [Kineococcus aurantiacus]|uniref:Putative membrane protein n=2 Tax=Kineococcus aurantiacus TaxID=37633 RepID=A0A7Y9J207_9ACTN|nr:putative membrane protein [Kineococcus aurantiacus]